MRRLSIGPAGGAREALLRVPDGGDGPAARPGIVVLHGAGGTAAMALGNTGWTTLADREGVLLIYPEGTRPDPGAPPRFLQNPQAWNDGSGRGHTARNGVDDIGFLGQVLDTLVERHGADPARLYLVGFSNGASMAFRAGAVLAEKVAAIGPVAGHCWETPRAGRHRVPALMLYGGVDPLNPPAGGEVKTPWGTREYHPPVLESFTRWCAFNGCTGGPARPTSADGVEEYRGNGCGPGADVRCLLIRDLGHHWPGAPRLLPPWIAGPASTRVDGAGALWAFFRDQQRR